MNSEVEALKLGCRQTKIGALLVMVGIIFFLMHGCTFKTQTSAEFERVAQLSPTS